MGIRSEIVEVGTSATLLVDSAGTSVNDKRQVILSDAEGDITIGGPSVTAGAGLVLGTTSTPYIIDIGPGDDLYGIAASALDITVVATRS